MMSTSKEVSLEAAKKSDNDTVINVVGSSKLFQPISKKASSATFVHPNKMLGSIVVK